MRPGRSSGIIELLPPLSGWGLMIWPRWRARPLSCSLSSLAYPGLYPGLLDCILPSGVCDYSVWESVFDSPPTLRAGGGKLKPSSCPLPLQTLDNGGEYDDMRPDVVHERS